MTCPPSPGVLAYLACALAALWANPLALAGLLLSLGAAVSAVLLARRRPDHGPIRILCLVWVADILGWLLAPALASGGPFTGWPRVAQHLDSARFLVWPLAVQVMVGLSFVESDARRHASAVLRVALPGFYALMLAIAIVCYPELRGQPLGRFYACIQANVVVWSLVVGASWALRHRSVIFALREPLFSPARAVASLLVALSLLSAVAGPWWRGLFGATYRSEQVILIVLFAAIVGVQVWALAKPPRFACFRAPETLGDAPPQA